MSGGEAIDGRRESDSSSSRGRNARRLRSETAVARTEPMSGRIALDGRFLRMTPNFERRLGFQEGQLVGNSVRKVVHPLDSADDRMLRSRLLRDEIRSFEVEKRLRDAAGRTVWMRLAVTLERGAAGQPTCFVVDAVDVTERRAAEEELRRTNAILHVVTAAQSAYIASSDSKAVFQQLLDVLLEVTSSEYGFIGEVRSGTDGALTLESCAAHVPQRIDGSPTQSERRTGAVPDLGAFVPSVEVVFRTGEPMIRNDAPHASTANGESANDARSESPELRELLVLPFRHDDEVVGMCGVANRPGGYSEDLLAELEPLLVTCASLVASVRLEARRAATEQALAESERRFRGYFDLDLIGIAMSSPSKGWLEVNDRMCSMLGRSREQLRTMTWAELTHPDDLAADLANFDRVLRGEIDAYAMEKRFLKSDGQVLHATLSVRCLRLADGRVDYFVALVQDITELRREQEERRALERGMFEAQKLESLGVLAGGIAHDFNNLLTGILGNAGLARCAIEEKGDPDVHLGQIERAAARAADLCRQMLAYAGKGRFVVAPLDLADLVRGTIDLLRLSIKKTARLRIDLDTESPPVVGDETQIRQVVMNLVINASDALPAAGGSIDIRVQPIQVRAAQSSQEFGHGDLKVGGYVMVEVRDEGMGMSRETLGRMFDPFFTTKFTGRGLGLSAVLGIMKAHDAAVRVSSVEGQGTTFRLFFPAFLGEKGTSGSPARGAVQDDNRATRSLAMVVDDEPLVAETVASMLRHLSFEVIVATSGAQAIEMFRENVGRISVVLVDLTMPEMDGLAVGAALHAIDEGARLISMSGYSVNDSQLDRVTAQFRAHLSKPFKVGDLRELLGSLRD